jgi:hypothetical protein
LLIALPFVDFALIAAWAAMFVRAYVPLALCGLLVIHSSIYAIRAAPYYAVAPTHSSVFNLIIGGLSSFFGTGRSTTARVLPVFAWALRIYAIAIFSVLVLDDPTGFARDSVGQGLWLTVAAYALLWAPLTLLAIDTDAPPPGWLWPLAPLWAAPRIRTLLGRLVPYWLAVLGGVVVAALMMFVSFRWLFPKLDETIGGGVPILGFGLALGGTTPWLMRRLRNQRRIRADKRYCAGLVANQTPLDAADAANALVVLRTDVGIQELVRALRREELAWTDGAVTFFEDFVATLRESREATESGPNKRKVKGLVAAPGVSAEFQAWIDERNASDAEWQRLRALDLDTIDQLGELVVRRLASGNDRVSALG